MQNFKATMQLPPEAYHLHIKFGEHDACCSHPERTEEFIDHPMEVVQRQHVQDNILLLPLPFFNQSCGLQNKTDEPALGKEERLSWHEKLKGLKPQIPWAQLAAEVLELLE